MKDQMKMDRRLWLPWLIALLLMLSVRSVLADWDAPPPITVDASSANVGVYSSLAVVDGTPAISYYDYTNTALKYARAMDATGTSWISMTVDNSANVGHDTSLAVVNGTPAISYYDYTNTALKYARAMDATGTSWILMTVDNSADVGTDTSLAVVNGNPAISYCDSTNGTLKYARATDAAGTSWVSMTVDANANLCRDSDTSLTVVNGNPAISYHDIENGNLKYARATDANGTTWISMTVDASSTVVGSYTSLAVVNGSPAISYLDSSMGALKYARATDIDGTSWISMTVDDSDSTTVGLYTSLTVVNGNPAISYYEVDTGFFDGSLKYARATNISGTAWHSTTLYSARDLGSTATSLQVIDNHPAISCHDDYNGELVYLRSDNPNLVTLTSVNPQHKSSWLSIAVIPMVLMLGVLMILQFIKYQS